MYLYRNTYSVNRLLQQAPDGKIIENSQRGGSKNRFDCIAVHI